MHVRFTGQILRNHKSHKVRIILSFCKTKTFFKRKLSLIQQDISQILSNTLNKLLILKFWSLETNHKFWVDLETVMLLFHKILQSRTWSIFIITQNRKIIFKSNQSLWKFNSIIYNFHVYTKSQFKTETYEKDARTWNMEYCHCATHRGEQFTRHGEFSQALHASGSPPAREASCDRSQQLSSQEKPHFFPKIPIFDSLMPKLVPKVCPNVYRHKKTFKTIWNLNQKHFFNTNHKFTHFSQNSQKQFKFHHNLHN